MSSTDLHPDARPAPTLPAELRLGAVELTVRDVDRSVAWYRQALGLRVHRHDATAAALGDGDETLVVLQEDPIAEPAGRGTAGLYHYALLYPAREELARAAARLVAHRVPVDGASDHGTHEAIYLPDPDGNGLELAWDRARELWPSWQNLEGHRPQPLDFPALMATIAGEPLRESVAAGLRMGHLHLHVGDVAEAIRFYRDVIGFAVQADLGTAAFASAGGYHHHLGMNVWNGQGVGAPPPHTAGLRHWTIVLPTAADVAAVEGRLRDAGAAVDPVDRGLRTADPFGTAVEIVAAEPTR
jgi:catechol 2,3-dioxygenase